MGINRLFRTGIMLVRSIFILISLYLYAFNGYSQGIIIEKSERIEKIDGKEYYIHTVEKGQTLYSISKAYDVLISEIIFENPIALDGIQPGNELKIIVKSEKEKIKLEPLSPSEDGNFVLHHVKPQETLYSLSKQYNVDIEAIRKANGELLNEGLRIGLVIKIPVASVMEDGDLKNEESKEDIQPFVLNKDTVYPPGNKKDKYSIVYMLPLFLDMNDTITQHVSDMEPDHIYDEALIGLEFFQGAQLALDSLKKNGLSADVYVYDSENDVSKVRNLFYKPEVKNADIIIGPFYKELFSKAQQLSQASRIPIVSPVLRDNYELNGKTNSAKAAVSEQTEIREISKYISTNFCNEKVLVIHKGREEELKKVEWFRNAYRCDSSEIFTEINYKSSGWDSLSHSLSNIDTNIVVVLSDDQAFVTSFFITLDKKKEDYPMKVFGVRSWLNFENIETDYYHDLQLHLPVENIINYDDSLTIKFVKSYRERYKNEPGYFSYLGFDLTYYFLSSFDRFGTGGDYLDKLSIYKWEGLQSRYRFERRGWETGVENQAVYIAKYKDFQLKKVN